MFPNLQLSFNKFQLSSAETPREENSWSQICRDCRGYLAVFRVDVLIIGYWMIVKKEKNT